MKLLDIINKKFVIPDLKAKNKWDAIKEIVEFMAEKKAIPKDTLPAVLDAVYAHEKSMSTGMSDNVALPHGTTDAVENVIGALGICKKGIPFDTLDGKYVNIICLLVYPQGTFRRHVRTQAGIARLLSDPEFRQSLIQAETVGKIIKIIEENEGN